MWITADRQNESIYININHKVEQNFKVKHAYENCKELNCAQYFIVLLNKVDKEHKCAKNILICKEVQENRYKKIDTRK